jgi:YfiH family protein
MTTPAITDLGGGFVSLTRPDGATMVAARALPGSGAVGLMSPVSVNGRLDADARAWLDVVGVERSKRLISLDQQHGATVLAATSVEEASFPSADGAWTESKADVLAIRTADCAAIWIVDPRYRRLCMLHVGWRGAAEGIVATGVRALTSKGGEPRRFVVAVGPHLGPGCFEVGPEVAAKFEHIEGAVLPASDLEVPRMRTDSFALDFATILRHEFEASGVSAGDLNIATTCTRCHPELFHSYRRNGAGGPLMVSIGMLTV